MKNEFMKLKVHKILYLCKILGFQGSDYEECCHLCSGFQLLVTANVSSSLILSTLMMEVIHSSETPVLSRST
jgi:hypothetical protein